MEAELTSRRLERQGAAVEATLPPARPSRVVRSAPERPADEQRLAVEVFELRQRLWEALFDCPAAMRAVLTLGRGLKEGSLVVREVVETNGRGEPSRATPPSPEDLESSSPLPSHLLSGFRRLELLYAAYTEAPEARRESLRPGLHQIVEALALQPVQLRRIVAQVGALAEAGREAKQWATEHPAPRSGRGPRALAAQSAQDRLAAIERSAEVCAALLTSQAEHLDHSMRALQKATSKMVEGHLGLVFTLARRYVRRGLEYPDLVQEGTLGMIRAVEKFDHRRGFRFSTYAQWWVRQAMTRALVEKGRTIRMPVHVHERLTLLSRARASLSNRLGREPTAQELAELLGVTVERVLDDLRTVRPTLSLDAPVGSDSDAVLGDFVYNHSSPDPSQSQEQSELGERMRQAMVKLKPREQQVLTMRYGLDGTEPKTLEEIGRAFGLTRERVRQIEVKALKRLRRPVRLQKLDVFLSS